MASKTKTANPDRFLEDLPESTGGVRHCAECTKTFERARKDQRYCSVSCRKAANNRAQARGLALYAAAMHWRKFSRSKVDDEKQDAAAMFGLMCRQLDAFRKEDEEAGRKMPLMPE